MERQTQLEAKAFKGGYTNSKLPIAIAFCNNKSDEHYLARLL
jgi:hypothetical protein